MPTIEAPPSVVVIGAGFSGLAAATSLADMGYEVTVVEKHKTCGGRSRIFETDGFTFDMGPSWYWMPDVFEEYFAAFGKKVSDYYHLKRLDPCYRLFLEGDKQYDMPDSVDSQRKLFESLEQGSAKNLKAFMKQAKYKYDVGMSDYVKRPSLSLFEFIDPRMIIECFRLQMLTSQRRHVNTYFKNTDLRKIMEWPVLFLGGSPADVPAMYSLINYSAMEQGTWYPEWGMYRIVDAMEDLARSKGVQFRMNSNVTKVLVRNGAAAGVEISNGEIIIKADYVVGAADYHFVEQTLLPKQFRRYSEEWWRSQTMSPSSLLFYLGVNAKVPNLEHHNLFFDESLDVHSYEIYNDPKWPSKPLFYVCCPSKTDPTVAPDGNENLFILIPLAVHLEDTKELREKYYNMVMDRLEERTGFKIRDHVVSKTPYCHKDFEADYNAYGGNAYGLANLLSQTAVFKPTMKSKLRNMYFAGQLTCPGPGVPPSLISGQMVAKLLDSERTDGQRVVFEMWHLYAAIGALASLVVLLTAIVVEVL
eukprot:Clim_evm8s198 gene=Clim_evmTU8s198